jgi:hypothetical protein
MTKLLVLNLLLVWSLALAGQPSAGAQPSLLDSAHTVAELSFVEEAPPYSPIHTWNELALATVRDGRLSDAQAARLYAMVNVAMYDAVNGIDSARGRDRRDHALVGPAGAPVNGNRYAAASAAAHAVLTQLYPPLAGTYQGQLDTDLAAIANGRPKASGAAWGARVGTQVVALRQNDGSTPNETQPGGTGPGVFRAAWSGVQFRNLAPFAIADPSRYVTSGPPPMISTEYAAALATVKILGSAAIPDQYALETYEFWASNVGSSQPPGEWIKVALIVSNQQSEPLALSRSARLFALLGMALSDAVAPTFTTKYTYQSWRPATAIREADTDGNPYTDADPGWAPRAGGIGGSPEHTSGHSSFAGAGTTILRGFFCADNISFELRSDSAPNTPRRYRSFSHAEAEAGWSRILGGIHFDFSNQAGLWAGRGIADEVLATALLRAHGPTHFGQCPL